MVQIRLPQPILTPVCTGVFSWSQFLQHFRRVLFRLHFGPDFLDLAFGIYEEGHTIDAVVFATHEFFSAPNAVSIHNGFVFIGKQHEREAVFRHEFIVLCNRIAAHAEQHGVGFFKCGVFITERAGFFRSARRVVLGIKEQHYVAALEIF